MRYVVAFVFALTVLGVLGDTYKLALAAVALYPIWLVTKRLIHGH